MSAATRITALYPKSVRSRPWLVVNICPNGFVDGGLVGVFIDVIFTPVSWYLDGGWTAPLHLTTSVIYLPPE